jgi:hypothetical protein
LLRLRSHGGGAWFDNDWTGVGLIGGGGCGAPCPVSAGGHSGSSWLVGVGAQATDSTRWGWMVGVGIEYAFANNWSVKAEYNHMDFGRETETLQPLPGGGCVAWVAPWLRSTDRRKALRNKSPGASRGFLLCARYSTNRPRLHMLGAYA